jgi:hypothetical protein
MEIIPRSAHPGKWDPGGPLRRTPAGMQAHLTIQNLTTRSLGPEPPKTTGGWIGRPGGHGGEHTPDPIPNSDVKVPSAHGTVSQGTGE